MNKQFDIKELIPLGVALALSILALLDGGFDHNVIYFAIFLLSVVLLVDKLKTPDQIWQASSPELLILLFLFWAGASIFWSLNPHRTLVEFLQLACYSLVLFITRRLSEGDLLKIGRIVLVTGTGIALLGISAQIFIGPGRLEGTFTNPNPMGIYFAMVFLFTWGYYLRYPNRPLVIFSVIIATALILTGSRGSYISFLLSSPLLFISDPKTNIKNNIFRTMACIGIAFLFTRLIMIINLGNLDILTRPHSFIASSGVGRFTFWKAAWLAALTQPIFGHGHGTQYLAYYLGYDGSIWYARFTHNHYLQIFVELGIVGIGFFLAFITSLLNPIKDMLSNKGHSTYVPGITAAIVAFLIHIGVDFSWNFPGTTALFFALVGAALNLRKNYKTFNVKSAFLSSFTLIIVLLALWQLSANLLYSRGVTLALADKLYESTSYYETANTIYPINPNGLSFASDSYIQIYQQSNQQEYLDKALDLAKQAVALSPLDGTMHNRLGKLYWYFGDIELAESHLSLAVKYAAYRIAMHLDLGYFYYQQKNYDNSKQVLLNALTLSDVARRTADTSEQVEIIVEHLVTIHLILANIAHTKNDTIAVTTYMEGARELNPNHPTVLQYFSETK